MIRSLIEVILLSEALLEDELMPDALPVPLEVAAAFTLELNVVSVMREGVVTDEDNCGALVIVGGGGRGNCVFVGNCELDVGRT